MGPAGSALTPDWFGDDSVAVAPRLLNKVIAVRHADGWRWARLVEVEAYAGYERASHSYGGPRPRNAVMYGPPARLYVYFTYGMHWCANVVTGPPGSAQAVLLRAAEPLGGIAARPGLAARDLCRGPARLARSLGLDGGWNGAVLASGARRPVGAVVMLDDGVPPPAVPAVGPRVGISKATELLWRWWVPDSRHVSSFRPGRPATGRPTGPGSRPGSRPPRGI